MHAQLAPIGDWISVLPYHNVVSIAETNDRVYAASESGMFYYEKEDQSVQRLSTREGLSGVNISSIGSSLDQSTLLVGYSDGIIDIIQNNTITPRLDVQRANIIGDKTINHFNYYNDICYVSTGFGIIEYNYNRQQVDETFLIGTNNSNLAVYQTQVFMDSLFAITEDGVYKSEINEFMNQSNNWVKDNSIIISGKTFDLIQALGNNLLVNQPSQTYRNDSVYSYFNGSWSLVTELLGESNRSFSVDPNANLVVSASTSVEVYDSTWTNVRRLFTYGDDLGMDPNYAFIDDNNTLWVGDRNHGMAQSRGQFDTDVINLGGPVSNKSYGVFHSGNKLYVTGGGITANWFTFQVDAEISEWNGSDWLLYNRVRDTTLNGLKDVTKVSENPLNKDEYYASSINGGLIHFKNNQIIEVLDHRNSPLEAITGDLLFVSDVEYDKVGNLWIGNSETDQPLKVFANDGKWYGFNIYKNQTKIRTGRLLVTSKGHIWISTQNDGLVVYDPGPLFGDTLDDRYKFFSNTVGSGNLPSNDVYAMAEDADGNVWVGTSLGLRVFFNAGNVFDSDFSDSRDILIDQDGQTKILFENQSIYDIDVNGSGQLWFSSLGAGAYLMSSDGREEILHFTTENSPLFSDIVQSIAIDNKTGEIFFATDKGLIAYRGTATEGNNDFNNMAVFPNPVSPNYEGVVGISGLMDNSSIVITDASGNLVQRTVSEGGQASWNLTNVHGDKVKPGVYLIFSTDEQGSDKNVVKLLVAE